MVGGRNDTMSIKSEEKKKMTFIFCIVLFHYHHARKIMNAPAVSLCSTVVMKIVLRGLAILHRPVSFSTAQVLDIRVL